jgi:hypothetical protein
MSSPNNAFKTYRNLSTTGATAETGILSCAVGMHRGGGVQLLGTFTATLQFEESLDGGTTWIAKTVYPAGGGAGVTSATGTGQWKFANGGSTNFRVRCSAFTSGPVAVALTLTEGVDPQAQPARVIDPVTGASLTWESSYVRLTDSGAVKSGAGVLDRIAVSAAGSTITINIYDNTAGSGTLIFGPYVLVAGASIAMGAAFGTGCYITFSATTGTPSLTAFYR